MYIAVDWIYALFLDIVPSRPLSSLSHCRQAPAVFRLIRGANFSKIRKEAQQISVYHFDEATMQVYAQCDSLRRLSSSRQILG